MRQAIHNLEESKIREVANAGMGRSDVLAFWFGESDQPTPAFIREATARALMAGIPNVTFATVGGTPPGKAGTVQGQVHNVQGRPEASRSVSTIHAALELGELPPALSLVVEQLLESLDDAPTSPKGAPPAAPWCRRRGRRNLPPHRS